MYPGDKLKHDFDADLAKGNGGTKLPHWTIHDLRRTAKTLMRRAGVSGELSERVLGHAIAGVEGVYDRHSYTEEKADALVRLAVLVERILDPAPNVVPITASASPA
jgi:integrase